VDEEAVKRFWSDADPIGKRITFNNPQQDSSVTWITVVGVVAHTKHEGLDAENRLQVYFPMGQMLTLGFGGSNMALAVRTTGDPRQSLGAVRGAIQGLDPDVPIAGIATMEENISNSMGQRRFSMLLLVLFAALALTLASIGIYGVMSFAVTQRSHELGVRMTLGATRQDVLRLVMRNGMVLVLVGAGIGALGSLALKRVIQSQLFGVSAADPVTWVAVTTTLLGVAALATLIPAMRATRVDPVAALREE
jgi:putative ABC transport system permease protein